MKLAGVQKAEQNFIRSKSRTEIVQPRMARPRCRTPSDVLAVQVLSLRSVQQAQAGPTAGHDRDGRGCGDGAEAAALVEKERPDVLLLDLRMPKLDGVAVTERLRSKFSDLAIVILSTYDTDDDILRALRAGAKAYLLKDTPPDDWPIASRRFIPAATMSPQRSAPSWRPKLRRPPLSFANWT